MDDWHTDFRNAVKIARSAGKSHLVIFTGYDWEPWSRKLREEVLSDPSFRRALAPDFVVTFVDLPATPEAKERPSEKELYHYGLARDFNLHVLPSLYLCTPEGRPYGLVGYEKGGAEPVITAILAKRSSYLSMTESIRGLEGPSRALAIDAWLKTLPDPLRSLRQDKMEMIVESDPENETGLRLQYQLALLLPKARRHRYSGELDQAEALYLEVVNHVKPASVVLQDTLYELADVYFQRKDYDKLLDALDRAIEAAPESPRMAVLDEMMEVFTRQWIYTKYRPVEMKTFDHDYKKIQLSPDETKRLVELAIKAKDIAPKSRRNGVLDRMIRQMQNL